MKMGDISFIMGIGLILALLVGCVWLMIKEEEFKENERRYNLRMKERDIIGESVGMGWLPNYNRPEEDRVKIRYWR